MRRALLLTVISLLAGCAVAVSPAVLRSTTTLVGARDSVKGTARLRTEQMEEEAELAENDKEMQDVLERDHRESSEEASERAEISTEGDEGSTAGEDGEDTDAAEGQGEKQKAARAERKENNELRKLESSAESQAKSAATTAATAEAADAAATPGGGGDAGAEAAPSAAAQDPAAGPGVGQLSDDRVFVSPECEVCRKMVAAHSTRVPGKPTQLFKPCRAVAPEMRSACETWSEDNAAAVGTETEPSRVCIALGFCDGGMCKYLDGLDAADAKLSAGANYIQSGTLLLDQTADIMAEMVSGSGPRRVNSRVEFNVAFEQPPEVFVALSGLGSPRGNDLRVRAYAVGVDVYGFDIDVLTWFESKIDTVGVDWIAWSKGYGARGEIRSGAIKLDSPRTVTRPVYFPGTFAIPPHVVIAVVGMDAANSRPIEFSARALAVTRDKFDLVVEMGPDTVVSMAKLSWLAFQNTTRMYAGSTRLSADKDKDFKNFFFPPLGPRTLERDVVFNPVLEGACDLPPSDAETSGAAGAAGAATLLSVRTKAGSKAEGKTESKTTGMAKAKAGAKAGAKNAPPVLIPSSVSWDASTRVAITIGNTGARAAFVLASDPGCREAAHSSSLIDAERSVYVNTTHMVLGEYKLCLGPAVARSDADFAPQGAVLTVVRSAVTVAQPVLVPFPPDLLAPLSVEGNNLRNGDLIALVKQGTFGCVGAAASAGIVTPAFTVAVKAPRGDYKVCRAGPSAASDADFVEQWARGAPLSVHVGGGAPVAPALPETSLSNAVLNDVPLVYWRLEDQPGSVTVANAAPPAGTHAGRVQGPGVTFGEGALFTGVASSASFAGGSVSSQSFSAFAEPRFSVEAWVQTGTGSLSSQGIVQRGGSEGGGFALFLAKDVFVCETANSRGETSRVESARVVLSKTYHVVCTFAKDRLTLFLNGFEVGKTPEAVAFGLGGQAAAVVVGAFYDWQDATRAANGWRGRIGGVAVYQGVLPPTRVYLHFTLGFLNDGSMSRCLATEVKPPLFSGPPNIRTVLGGFSTARDAPLFVKTGSLRTSEASFVLEVSSWADSRIKNLDVQWIAHEEPPVPPRLKSKLALRKEAEAADKQKAEPEQ